MTRLRALLLLAALAAFHLWPLSAAPARLSLNYNADAQYNAWAMAWINETLPTRPGRLFDANIFAPEPRTLAYSHPIVTPALLGAPVLLLGGSPVLAFNLALFAGLVLTAWCTWFVVRDWTGSSAAALVSGALAAFNVQLLVRLPHITAANAWGLPLALYFAERVARRRRWCDAGALAAVIALTAGTSFYWLAAVLVIVAVTTTVAVQRPWGPPLLMTSAAAAAGLGAAVPLLLPYLSLAEAGVRRPIEMVADYAATPAGYLVSTSWLHAWWSAPLFSDELNAFFPGVAAFGLGVLGLWTARSASRRRIVSLLLIAAVAVWLSFGPATAAYRWAYEWFMPLQGLRATARFGSLYLFVIAVAAGFGVAWLQRRTRSPRLAALVPAAALLLVTAEAWRGPVRTEPFTRVPPIYSLLADVTGPVLLVEVPFYPPEAVHFNGEYVLNSTAHWRPLMNGTSGITPASYRTRAEAFWFFPRDWAIREIQRHGATHVMVHLDRFDGRERLEVEETLAGHPDLQLLASDSYGHRLYELAPADEEDAREGVVLGEAAGSGG